MSDKIRVIIFVLIAISAIVTSLNTLMDAYNGQSVISDDAYYYIVTAKHYVKDGIVSFDGIHETNGFHPLWFLIIVALFKIGINNLSLKDQYFSLVLIEQVIWLTIILLIMIYGYKNKNDKNRLTFSYFILIWLIYPLNYRLFHLGMETTLAALLLIVLLYYYEEGKEKQFSVISFFVVLCRLDLFLFVIFPLFIIYLVKKYPIFNNKVRFFPSKCRLTFYEGINKYFIKKLLLIFGLPCLALGSVAIYNYLNFGKINTISGILKSSFPKINFHPTFLLDDLFSVFYLLSKGIVNKKVLYLLSPLPIYLVIIFVIVLICQLKKRITRSLLDNKLFLYSLIGIILLFNLILFQKWDKGIDSWYLVIPTLLLGIIISIYLSEKLCINKVFIIKNYQIKLYNIIYILLLSIILFNSLSISKKIDNKKMESSFDLWIKQIDPKAVFAATDCGYAAFWSNRTFINLDGLINDYDYQEIIQENKLYQYLIDNGVDYITVGVWDKKVPYILRKTDKMYESRIAPDVLNGNYSEYIFYVYSYMYNKYSDKIIFSKDDEVFRSEMGTDARGSIMTRLIVWKLRR